MMMYSELVRTPLIMLIKKNVFNRSKAKVEWYIQEMSEYFDKSSKYNLYKYVNDGFKKSNQYISKLWSHKLEVKQCCKKSKNM